jgi:hypothetical protein
MVHRSMLIGPGSSLAAANGLRWECSLRHLARPPLSVSPSHECDEIAVDFLFDPKRVSADADRRWKRKFRVWIVKGAPDM